MPDNPKPGWKCPEWGPVPQSEYAEMNLFDQHRHVVLLAMRYRRMAGPMMQGRMDQKPVNQANWDKYTPMAEKCEAEAARLAKYVHSAKVNQANRRHGESPTHVEFDLNFMRDAA